MKKYNKNANKEKGACVMVAKMKRRVLEPVVKVGSRVGIKRESNCKYADMYLYIKNIYTKNGNTCVDLVSREGKLLVIGMRVSYLKKAR